MQKVPLDKVAAQTQKQRSGDPMKKDKTVYRKIGNSTGMIMPADVAKDSTFPFQIDDEVEVEISGGTLLIRKAPDLTNNKRVTDYE